MAGPVGTRLTMHDDLHAVSACPYTVRLIEAAAAGPRKVVAGATAVDCRSCPA